ncbi:MAG TPA: hypothetical protein VJP02_30775 [Candidatus Sulfotelmatobacter sp.]|nr:hypothetical protein [Candidatus Sulfotelmatobacter sp.]
MLGHLFRRFRSVLLKSSPKVVVAIPFLLGPTILFCQQSDVSTPTDPQTIRLLLERISQLEANQKQMGERLAQLERAQPAADPKAEARDEKLPVDQTGRETDASASPSPQASSSKATSPDSKESAVADPERQDEMSEHMDVSKTLLNIRGFGDFGLYGGTQNGQTTSFSIGQINLFITSNLSERFKFLTELVFEVQQDNSFQAVPERVLLEWSLNDYFKLAAGRYHTAIGYYNTAYHHATWFQTATERPYVFEYEDEGGILPIHIVGLEASGQIPSGKLGLNYVAQVGNGRSSDPLVEPVQNYVDDNSRKSVNLAVFARPDSIPGLQVGFSAYKDVLSTNTSPRIDETILDAYAVMLRPRFEWLNEALMIRHALTGQHVFDTPAFYSQISERFGMYRPYLRYQYINAASQEPVFPNVGLRTGPSVGIRFDPTASVALKLQYDHTLLRRQPGINGQTCPQLQMCAPNAVGMQVDFKF